MSQATQSISPGLPVPVGEIDRKLGELWSASDAGKVRASLVNLVIYSEAADAIAVNTPLLAEIAADHAFRALLVQADPAAKKTDVEAWITAHCHIREAGGPKEICSEQITFRLEGPAAERLPNIVFSHLDSDLPLYFWWRGNLHPEPDARFWTRVDRLIVDSQSWDKPGPQFALLRGIEALGAGRCAVCDLNWTRSFHLRYAIAQIFDVPAAREKLPRLEKVTIRHGAGHRLTALEVLGWIASRLGWHLEHGERDHFFRRRDGGESTYELLEDASSASAIAAVGLHFPGAEAVVEHATKAEFCRLVFESKGGPSFSQMLPAGREKVSDILLSELARAGKHPLFWPAIRAIEPLL